MNDLSTDGSMTIRDAAQQLRDFVDQLDRLADKAERLPIELCVVCSVRAVPINDQEDVANLATILTAQEAAERLSTSADMVRGLVRCGALDGHAGAIKTTVSRLSIDRYLRRDQAAANPDPLLTMTEAARRLRVSRRLLYYYRKNGRLRVERQGRSVLVRLSDLNRIANDPRPDHPADTPQPPLNPAK